ncbi:FKBP-type peptidyl-prolyl cis-trans isomerase N-terminal domain-containing protein [Yersinia intermedia]|uniref:FKBP-type peptidyl-prolyl cis-trans isomerase N-terminal domain-containing protein n=1 Tax=Yersinia intermedia TaxID=631 RepID=UPI0011A8CAFB|nr:FKBP-type peptidyl-prolyl cis-trans isomerase N-terminal domain-containing protein [Yersinia intermedia]MDN0116912.1 FKBP-type peptidyl-prolyl cis-trans isomerase N-terminal domain-containing protein [Yersinia intermedia]
MNRGTLALAIAILLFSNSALTAETNSNNESEPLSRLSDILQQRHDALFGTIEQLDIPPANYDHEAVRDSEYSRSAQPRLQSNTRSSNSTTQLKKQLAKVQSAAQQQKVNAEAQEKSYKKSQQRLSAQIAQLKQQLSEAQKRPAESSLRQVGEQVSERIRSVWANIQKPDNTNRSSGNNQTQLTAQINDLTQQLTAAKNLNAQRQADLDALKLQLAAAEKASADKLAKADSAAKAKDDQSQKLTAQIADLQQKLTDSEKSAKEMQAQTTALMKDADSGSKEMAKQLDALKLQLAASEKASADKLAKADSAAKTKDDQSQKLTAQIADLQQKLKDTEKSSSELQTQAENNRKEAATQITMLQHKLNAVQKRDAGKQERIDALSQSLDSNNLQLNIKIDTLQQQLAAAEKTSEEQKSLMAVQEVESKKRVSQIEALQQQLADNKKSQEQSAVQTVAANKGPSAKPVTNAEKQAYANGIMYARQLREINNQQQQMGLVLDNRFLVSGFNDEMNKQSSMSSKDLSAALTTFNSTVDKKMNELATKSEKSSNSYLQEFDKKKGVKKSPSGFSYQVVSAGNNKKNTGNGPLRIQLRESLSTGVIVSDTDKLEDKSITIYYEQLPPLLQEGINMIGEGGFVKIVVPAQLVYGDAGSPPLIPPKSTLIYDLKRLAP